MQDDDRFELSISRLHDDGTSDPNSVFHINQGQAESDHSDPAQLPYIDHMHLDSSSFPGEDWLFGTTRSINRDKSALFVYIWKVKLDAVTREPDGTTITIFKIDGDFSGGSDDSYFSGIKSTLEANGDLHMMYKKWDRATFYFVYDWTSNGQDANSMSTKVEEAPGEIWSVFVGSQRETIGGVNRYQGYIGV